MKPLYDKCLPMSPFFSHLAGAVLFAKSPVEVARLTDLLISLRLLTFFLEIGFETDFQTLAKWHCLSPELQVTDISRWAFDLTLPQ